MSLLDGPAMIPTLSAIGGSFIGALSSMISTWIVQRHRERREVVAQKTAHLEQLYSDFINESARLLIDAAIRPERVTGFTPAHVAEFLQVIGVRIGRRRNVPWSQVRLEIDLENSRDQPFPALDHVSRGA